MSALIQAQHLHRYYADTHAVNDVSIELHQGDILGLLGPNGAGKSSCMQMLCGVLAPSAGEILINGVDLLDKPIIAKQHIGYLADKPPLYPELTVDEFLVYSAQLRGIKKSSIGALLVQAKERCGLVDYGKRLLSNLSKGYQQRAGIAQAIIHQPDIIILDEPTVGLDPIQMQQIRKLITDLGEQHGIILSTHILPEVQAVCNRVQMIHQGRSVFNQGMQDIKHSDQVVLELENAPQVSEIESLANVTSVDAIGHGRFLLSGQTLHQQLSEISQQCVTQNWGLVEISKKENTLEQVFLDVTSGEDKPQDESAA